MGVSLQNATIRRGTKVAYSSAFTFSGFPPTASADEFVGRRGRYSRAGGLSNSACDAISWYSTRLFAVAGDIANSASATIAQRLGRRPEFSAPSRVVAGCPSALAGARRSAVTDPRHRLAPATAS
jgi:hypothetical protein